MSLVIGMRTANAVVFGCDGFALLEDKQDGSTTKLETRTKLAVFHNWNLILGYVGETESLVSIVSPVLPLASLKALENGHPDVESQHLSEQEFLNHLGSEIRNLHLRDGRAELALVCGYYDSAEQPVVCYFDRDGSRRPISEFACIGSGSEIASVALAEVYEFDITIEDAARAVVDAVYEASVVPTVNTLPMIVVLRATGVHDFTNTTLEKYTGFRRDLRLSLIRQAASIG